MSADFFFNEPGQWQHEYKALRAIVQSTGLTEEVKWGVPCYTLKGKNVVLIHGFKDYCALLFHKGALLNDAANILIQQTENVQAARQIRFTGMGQIVGQEDVLKSYILQAIDIEISGKKVALKETREFAMPDELKARLDADGDLKAAFEALTPGRQRAYLLHFSQAKQTKTREARIEKAIPDIFAGKGLND